jgi:hypothetical protein
MGIIMIDEEVHNLRLEHNFNIEFTTRQLADCCKYLITILDYYKDNLAYRDIANEMIVKKINELTEKLRRLEESRKNW